MHVDNCFAAVATQDSPGIPTTDNKPLLCAVQPLHRREHISVVVMFAYPAVLGFHACMHACVHSKG